MKGGSVKYISLSVLLVLAIIGCGATTWIGSVDAADPALSEAIFYVA